MLSSNNREWGFYGTVSREYGEAFADEAWEAAFNHINDWMLWGEERTRDFLDSRCGRHLADRLPGRADWLEAITRYPHLEAECRNFYKEVDPDDYKAWCRGNGFTATERIMDYYGVTRRQIHQAVCALTGLDYTLGQIDDCIRRAGPLAKALAALLADLPEEIRETYLKP